VLADRGLGDAIRALALDTPLHTVLGIDLPEQVDMPVASAVYFSVAEALANVTKHAGARSVRIVLSHAAGMLRAEVTDDGAGGADPALGDRACLACRCSSCRSPWSSCTPANCWPTRRAASATC